MTVWEVDNAREIWTDDLLPKVVKSKWWHLWFQPLNMAVLALGICVLTGCRSPADVNYKLYSVNGGNVSQAMSRNCSTCKYDTVPENYLFGLSGLCRVNNETTKCQTGFAKSFNISAAVLADINPSWLSSNTSAEPTEQREQLPSSTSINHAQVSQLASAVSAIVIISVIISFAAVPITIWKGPMNEYIFGFLWIDSLMLFAAVIMFYSIFRQEVAGAYSPRDIPDGTVSFGLGAWFLVAVFVCRLLCDPWIIPAFFGTVLTGGLFLIVILVALLLPRGAPRPRFVGYATTVIRH